MAKRPSYISHPYPAMDVWSLVEEVYSEIEELGNECQEAADNFPNPSHPKAEAFSDVAQELQSVSPPDELDIPEDGPISTLPPIPQVTDLQIQIPSDKRRQTSRAMRLSNAVSKLQAAIDTLTAYRDDVAIPTADDTKQKVLEDYVMSLDDYIEALQETINVVDSLEFPGMFG